MKAVWSLWTKPLFCGEGIGWLSFKDYLFSWVLSVERGRQLFATTELVTDSTGAELLIKGLGLQFDLVSLALDEIQTEDPEWWVLGKLRTYALQDEAFVHIDHDVFLWKSLPEDLLTAPIVTQNPEPVIRKSAGWYQPEYLEMAIEKAAGGWLPLEWLWYTNQPDPIQTAYCCGIFGGNATPFIQHYAKSAYSIACHPANRSTLALQSEKGSHVVLLEQYFLSACLHYYVTHPNPDFGNICANYLFDSVDDAINRGHEVGYTHLIGYAKHDSDIMNRLEKRVRQDYPALYEKCVEIAAKSLSIVRCFGGRAR